MDEAELDTFLMNEFDDENSSQEKEEKTNSIGFKENELNSDHYLVKEANDDGKDKFESENSLGYPDLSNEADFSSANQILDGYKSSDLERASNEPKFSISKDDETEPLYPNLTHVFQGHESSCKTVPSDSRMKVDKVGNNKENDARIKIGMATNDVSIGSNNDERARNSETKPQPNPDVDKRQRLCHAWNNALLAASFTKSAANAYSRLFSHLLIDQEKTETITDKFLMSIGVLNKQHRTDLLRLFKRMKHMKKDVQVKTDILPNAKVNVSNEESTVEIRAEPLQIETVGSDDDSNNPKHSKGDLVSSWLAAMVQQGIPVDAAKNYARRFAEYDIDNNFISSITDENLSANGVVDPDHRKILINLVKKLDNESASVQTYGEDNNEDKNDVEEAETEYVDPDEVFPNDFLASSWYGAMVDRGLAHIPAKHYARLLSDNNIGENNAGLVDDDALRQYGVSNADHRTFILGLIDSLIKELKRETEAKKVTIDWEAQVERERQDAEAEIEEILRKQNHFEQQLAAILSGNTERQKKLRAKRAKERKQRDEARHAARRERALRKAQNEIERLKQELNRK